jgi:type IV pilus assembly protein PilF
MDRFTKLITAFLIVSFFSACVSQDYEKNTPVVQNDATQNEIAMTRISLGLGYLKMGNTTQAKLNLEKAKRFAPNLVQVYTAFAHYYDTVGEVDLTINSYEKAISLDGKDADTLNNYGVFLCKQEKYKKAEEQLLKAIEIPSYLLVAKSYQNLALCQLQSKDFVKAEQYLNKAILHSPMSGSLLLQMIELQYAKADYKSAQLFLKRYEKATRRFTPNALALAYKVYVKQGNKRIAKNYAGMLVKMFPNSFEAKQYLLNELEEIAADKLAVDYKLATYGKKKKRVVVLSPNKAPNKVAMKPLEKDFSEKKQKASRFSMAQAAKIETDKLKAAIAKKTSQVDTSPKKAIQTDENVSIALAKKTDQKTLTLPVHVIVKGDSLFSVSKKYNIHMKSLERWNNFSRTKLLSIGDVIYLANPKKAAKS